MPPPCEPREILFSTRLRKISTWLHWPFLLEVWVAMPEPRADSLLYTWLLLTSPDAPALTFNMMPPPFAMSSRVVLGFLLSNTLLWEIIIFPGSLLKAPTSALMPRLV